MTTSFRSTTYYETFLVVVARYKLEVFFFISFILYQGTNRIQSVLRLNKNLSLM